MVLNGCVMNHPRNPHIKNGLVAKGLLRASLHPSAFISRVLFLLTGCDIGRPLPSTTFLPHPQGIVVGSYVQLGSHVVIGHQVTLGGRDFDIKNMPVIEDGVYLGAGAKVLGQLKIGAGATIGANSVVTRDVPAGAVVVGANRILHGKTSAYAF
jgi:serine O-acetyltransferase